MGPMQIIKNIALARALLRLGAGLQDEIEAVMRRAPKPVAKLPEPLTRQQRRAKARAETKGRKA